MGIGPDTRVCPFAAILLVANIDLVTFDEILLARVFLLLFLAGKLYVKPRGFGNIILEFVLVEPCLAETFVEYEPKSFGSRRDKSIVWPPFLGLGLRNSEVVALFLVPVMAISSSLGHNNVPVPVKKLDVFFTVEVNIAVDASLKVFD